MRIPDLTRLSMPLGGAPAAIPSPPALEPMEPSVPTLPGGDTRWLMKPNELYLWDRVAAASPVRKDKEAMYALGLEGIGPQQYDQMQTEAEAAAFGQELAAGTAHLGDDDFESLYAQLQGQFAAQPQPTAPPELRGPSTGQLVLGGLAALFAPQAAGVTLAAPFQAALRQNDQETEMGRYQDAEAYRRWTQQINGTETQLALLDRRQARTDAATARADALDARREATAAAAEDRRLLQAERDDARADRDRNANYQKRENRIRQLVNDMSDETALPEGRYVSGQMALAEIRNADPNDPRIPIIQSRLQAIGAPGQKQIDDHKKSAADTAFTAARTLTENKTREGKVQEYIDKHDYNAARIEAINADKELDVIRAKYLDEKERAQINATNATANRARQAAQSMAAGMSGRPPKSADAWLKLGMKLEEAEVAARATIQGLTPQRAAIQRRLEQLGANLVAAQSDESLYTAQQKLSMEKERGELQKALSKIRAVYTEKSAYLEMVKGQRAQVQAQAQYYQPSPMAGAAPSGVGGSMPAPIGGSIVPMDPYAANVAPIAKPKGAMKGTPSIIPEYITINGRQVKATDVLDDAWAQLKANPGRSKEIYARLKKWGLRK